MTAAENRAQSATGPNAGAYVRASATLASLAIGLVTAWIPLVEVRRARPAANTRGLSLAAASAPA